MAYKQLTQAQRYQLYSLKKMSVLQKDIAIELGVDASTISRELARNTNKSGIYTKKAHQMALGRRTGKVKPRLSKENWQTIEDYLRDDLSPEQVHLRLLYKKSFLVSPEWIYQYIYHNKQQGGELYNHLRCKKKNRKRYGSVWRRPSLSDRRSIEDRPKIVDSRRRYGDWEIDTVIGRQGGAVLVTIVERKSKLSLMGLAINKTAQSVKEMIVKLLSAYAPAVHTLTYDNGPEFAKHKEIDQILRSKGYFCHPFSSGERGLNENTNGLIRQYLPKRMSFDNVSTGTIKWIIDKLNNRPRKALGGRTPNEVFFSGKRIALSC